MELEVRDWLTIAAIVVGPIVATMIALWVEARRRRRDWRERLKTEILYNLVRARAGFNVARNRDILESALNAIPVAFHGDAIVMEAYKKAHAALSSRGQSRHEAIVALILAVYKHLGYKNVDAEAIENIFLFPHNEGAQCGPST